MSKWIDIGKDDRWQTYLHDLAFKNDTIKNEENIYDAEVNAHPSEDLYDPIYGTVKKIALLDHGYPEYEVQVTCTDGIVLYMFDDKALFEQAKATINNLNFYKTDPNKAEHDAMSKDDHDNSDVVAQYTVEE